MDLGALQCIIGLSMYAGQRPINVDQMGLEEAGEGGCKKVACDHEQGLVWNITLPLQHSGDSL